MAAFPEGANWYTYNPKGFAECNSMAFRINGQDRTAVIKEPAGYFAISLVSGGLLTPYCAELNEAVQAAEAEALNPTNP